MTAGALPTRHRSAPGSTLRIARIADRTSVLGPGSRSVVWVQGCALRCPGCVVPESHAIDAGTAMTPRSLADRLLEADSADGVTFSGGEPFLQARGLAETIALLRAERPDWTFMSYSGYREEVMDQRGTYDQCALLSQLDLLIDGPFVRRLATSARWRGSSNQRIVVRTAAGERQMAGLDDSSQGIELEIATDGSFAWTGVAPDGFRAAFDGALARAGAVVTRVPEPQADATTQSANQTGEERS